MHISYDVCYMISLLTGESVTHKPYPVVHAAVVTEGARYAMHYYLIPLYLIYCAPPTPP